MEAGVSLFAARSVDAVSIDEIVAAADVAKGSFYNHFPDKDGLAAEIAAAIRAGVEAAVADINAGLSDPAERVARALCLFARNAVENPERVRAMTRLFPAADVADAPMDRGVRADIQAGLASGVFSGLGPEAAVVMAVGQSQAAISRLLNRSAERDPAGLAGDLAFGLLRGLGLEPSAACATALRAATDIFASKVIP